MARTLGTSTLNALNAGSIVDRGLIKFEFTSGTYGFWTGSGQYTYDSLTYEGVGSLIRVNAFPSNTSGSAIGVEVELSSIADTALTNDILASIYDEEYNQQPVTIYTAYIDADTRTTLSVIQEFAGKVDKLEYRETVGGEARLIGSLESLARDFTRVGFRRRSDADQRLIDTNDGSLRHVAKAATQKIFWGRATPKESNGGGAPVAHTSVAGDNSLGARY